MKRTMTSTVVVPSVTRALTSVVTPIRPEKSVVPAKWQTSLARAVVVPRSAATRHTAHRLMTGLQVPYAHASSTTATAIVHKAGAGAGCSRIGGGISGIAGERIALLTDRELAPGRGNA